LNGHSSSGTWARQTTHARTVGNRCEVACHQRL